MFVRHYIVQLVDVYLDETAEHLLRPMEDVRDSQWYCLRPMDEGFNVTVRHECSIQRLLLNWCGS